MKHCYICNKYFELKTRGVPMGHPKLKLLASNGVHIGHVIQYVKMTLTSCSMTQARPNPVTFSPNELMITHRYGS